MAVRTSSKIAIFAQLSIFDLLWTLPDGLTKHVPVHMIEQQQPHPRAETKKKTHAISRRSSMPLHPRNPNNLPPSITANIQTLVNHCLCRSCLTANELVDDSYTNGWNTECILLLYERYACYTYTKFAEGYLSQLMIVFSYIKIGIYSICPEI